MTGKALAVAAMVLLIAGAARADVHIRLAETTPDAGPGSVDIYVHASRVRIQQARDAGRYSVFNARTGTLTLVMPARRQYIRLTRKSADQARKQMEQQMEAQLANVPPAQREMVRKMMAQRNQAASTPPAPPQVQDTGRRETVAGIPCRLYRVRPRGAAARELCMASRGALHMSTADLDALRALASTGQDIARHLGGDTSAELTFDPSRMQGFPVLERPVEGQGETSQLQAIEHGALDPELFRIPAGYTERSLLERD